MPVTTLKKLVAAFLLFTFLFNIGGQLMLHQYFSYLSNKFFTEQTSKGLYNVNDLTEVKLPVNMPGISDWGAYENISGQIQFDNVSYNYVKMKITRTALYLMCVPDYKTTRLTDQNIIDARGVKSKPVPKKEHVPYGKTTFLGNFSFSFAQFAFSPCVKTLRLVIARRSQSLISHYPAIPEQPPRLAC